MTQTSELFLSLPEFVWRGIFNIISTLIVGLIIAFVTTFYLKRKDEITRVSGVILEKRVNSSQKILHFLEKLSFKNELKEDKENILYQLLDNFELNLPHGEYLQYSSVFESIKKYREFFFEFENIIAKNKLWMSLEVRNHLFLMQGYFSWINALVLMINTTPLPKGKTLSIKDIDKIADKIILQVGITLDSEISGLLAELETLIVDSIYHLSLKRPKKSQMRNGMDNKDTLKVLKTLERHTLFGQQKADYMILLIMQVYAYVGEEIKEEDIEHIIKCTTVDPSSMKYDFST